MKYLDFEKHIKNEFEDSKEVVQMDALLASLNLGKEPKRKNFAYWKIVPFLILGISLFAWKMGDFGNQSMKTYQTDIESTIEKSDSENNASIISPIQDKNVITTQKESLENTQSNILLSSNNKNTTKEKTETNSKESKPNTSIPTINTISPAITDSPINISSNINSTQNQNVVENSILNSSYVTQKSTYIESGSDINDASAGANKKSSRSLLSIADLDGSLDALENNNDDGNLFSRMKINCPSFDNAGWHMALIPEVGVFLPNKTLTNNSFEESAAFTERLNSESTLEGIELGLYGMLVRDNVPFYLKAGVSYSRISERMDLQYEYTKQDTTVGIISSTVSANGDTITHIYGDVITETTFKGSNRQHYYIHLFDVPISVGYSTYIGGLDVGIEGGVKINFMTRATGNLLTSQKDYTNLSLNRLFKNRIGLSYFGGLMIGRNFGRFGDFYIAPRFTYYPNDFNNQNNAVSQRYLTVGLNAGVVYKIN